MMKKILPAAILLCLIAMTPVPAFAVGSGGFENASFSAKQLGTGAAVTATPDEPAAISYNPAGIADLPGVQVQGDANFISMLTYKENETGNSRSTGTLHLVPTGYITINPGKVFGDKLAFGFGMDSPFGLSTKYRSNDPAAKYTGYSNYLKMYALKPTIAYKVTNKISVGGGPMWYRVYDFGGVQAYPSSMTGLFGTTDGQVRLNSSGNHWGWQLGTLIKLTEKHRVGYYFRSPVVVKVSGQGKVENSTAGLLAGYPMHDFQTGIHTKLALPMNMTWAYAYQPTPKTHYEVDFTWSHWKTHQRLAWAVDPVSNPFDTATLNAIRDAKKDYRDSFGIQLGASHKLTKKLTLRGGSWFYWTPIPTDHFIPAVPDANHLAVSIGAGYDINKYLTADLCYYNSFYFTRNISNSYVNGSYTTYSQAFTISLTAHWDDIFPRTQAKKDDSPSIDMKSAT